ncbi:hypothetical protein OJ253_3699, partial [Cryptosporidium canis]
RVDLLSVNGFVVLSGGEVVPPQLGDGYLTQNELPEHRKTGCMRRNSIWNQVSPGSERSLDPPPPQCHPARVNSQLCRDVDPVRQEREEQVPGQSVDNGGPDKARTERVSDELVHQPVGHVHRGRKGGVLELLLTAPGGGTPTSGTTTAAAADATPSLPDPNRKDLDQRPHQVEGKLRLEEAGNYLSEAALALPVILVKIACCNVNESLPGVEFVGQSALAVDLVEDFPGGVLHGDLGAAVDIVVDGPLEHEPVVWRGREMVVVVHVLILEQELVDVVRDDTSNVAESVNRRDLDGPGCCGAVGLEDELLGGEGIGALEIEDPLVHAQPPIDGVLARLGGAALIQALAVYTGTCDDLEQAPLIPSLNGPESVRPLLQPTAGSRGEDVEETIALGALERHSGDEGDNQRRPRDEHGHGVQKMLMELQRVPAALQTLRDADPEILRPQQEVQLVNESDPEELVEALQDEL